jgi:hypothetical protein
MAGGDETILGFIFFIAFLTTSILFWEGANRIGRKLIND